MFRKLFGTGRGTGAENGKARPPLPVTFDALQEMAFNHTQALMAGHEAWGVAEAFKWDVDLDAGSISWFFLDGRTVKAPAQLIGTWTGRDDSFLWGWDHPSAPPGSAHAAAAVKAHAERHAIGELQASRRSCGFEEGWQLAAIAVLVGDLQGVYRGQASPGTWAYLGFGPVTISRPKA